MTPPSVSGPILVVDDDQAVREVLTRALTKRGFAVTAASSGAQALEQLKASRYVLMLLDVRMPPGPSGMDLLPQVLDLDPELPIIMLTALADLTTAARCMQLGARDFLTKPIELSALNAAIDKTLGKTG